MTTVLMGMLWKRMNYAAGLFGLVGGLLIQVVMAFLFSGHMPPLTALHFYYVGAMSQVVIAIGIAIVTLSTPAPDTEKVSAYVWRLALLDQYDEGARRPWYQRTRISGGASSPSSGSRSTGDSGE